VEDWQMEAEIKIDDSAISTLSRQAKVSGHHDVTLSGHLLLLTDLNQKKPSKR
jgi:hypothetical protein